MARQHLLELSLGGKTRGLTEREMKEKENKKGTKSLAKQKEKISKEEGTLGEILGLPNCLEGCWNFVILLKLNIRYFASVLFS